VSSLEPEPSSEDESPGLADEVLFPPSPLPSVVLFPPVSEPSPSPPSPPSPGDVLFPPVSEPSPSPPSPPSPGDVLLPPVSGVPLSVGPVEESVAEGMLGALMVLLPSSPLPSGRPVDVDPGADPVMDGPLSGPDAEGKPEGPSGRRCPCWLARCPFQKGAKQSSPGYRNLARPGLVQNHFGLAEVLIRGRQGQEYQDSADTASSWAAVRWRRDRNLRRDDVPRRP